MDVKGLMTIPPPHRSGDRHVPIFARLRELALTLSAQTQRASYAELSMGMSNDYVVAVEEGATYGASGHRDFR